ncbi:BglG family transcription antiterminator [Bacillus sp. FJAT-50079]|uniref:BglG family transcription antiterminator n=1 Tax=Bacillus sp. FJAT-50079 TaxID=2833577 RepID=UPI001BC916DD|nr:BglG family transcription antiterminator [Bacillus sp. FJAT-50079]MBS4206671.1 transcription antiterminator [Bacillus sp. FJAT-50079]
MISLTKRQKKIVYLLISEQDYKTTEFYSGQIGVSIRTVHNDLKNIEVFLDEQEISLQKKPGSGIKIKASYEEKLVLLQLLNLNHIDFDPLSVETRRLSIFSKLLYAKQTTSLQKLSEEYMVSTTSIVKDLDKIEEWIRHYNIKLVRNRDGTSISGDEENIRRAISGIVNDHLSIGAMNETDSNTKSRLNTSTYNGLAKMFEQEKILIVEEIVEHAEKELGYTISEPYYTNILTHILILIERVKNGNQLLKMDTSIAVNDVLYTVTYKIAEGIAAQIKDRFFIEIDQNEIIYINQYLMSSGADREFLSNDNTQHFLNNLDEEIVELVTELISITSKSANIDLSNDKELYLGLVTHFKPLLNRLRFSIRVTNDLLEDIKNEYAATFALTWLACSSLEKKYNLKVNEDEIGYITLHFQAAIERQLGLKKVIVVCPGGIGTSHLVANRIKRYIPQLDIKDIVSINRLATIDLRAIDFIISTVPLNIEEKPVIVISSVVNEMDVRNINNFFTDFLFRTKNQKITCPHLLQVVDEDLIFTNLPLSNKDDVIEFLCQELENRDYVKSGYKETLLKREAISPTSLGKFVAIPHGSNEEVNVPKISIATLKDPVDWGKEPVKTVFLIAMKFNENINVKHILSDLYKLVDSNFMLEKITNCKTSGELINLLRSDNLGDQQGISKSRVRGKR